MWSPSAISVFRRAMPRFFALLEKAGIISAEVSKSLRGMAGFRNVAVHQYEELDMDVLRWVVETGHRG